MNHDRECTEVFPSLTPCPPVPDRKANVMQTIIGWAIIIGIGWLVIQILPTLLPFIGYAIVGLLALFILIKLFG